jgi:hypothetical protein
MTVRSVCGGEGVVGGEPAAGVTDLGEQGRGAHGARAGQAGEHRRVGTRGEGALDVVLQCAGALAQAHQQRD